MPHSMAAHVNLIISQRSAYSLGFLGRPTSAQWAKMAGLVRSCEEVCDYSDLYKHFLCGIPVTVV